MKESSRLALIAIALIASASSWCDDTPPITEVFLLAGQSNMDGRGDGSKLTAEDRRRLEAVRQRVYLAYNGRHPEPLDVTVPMPHIARKFGLELTFGPELFFGIQMAEAWPERKILLIKRSLGGTSLYGAWNPSWSLANATHMNEADSPKLFQELVNDIETTTAGLGGEPYRFAGMLWVQGETDSAVKRWGPAPAASYGDNLTALIQDIREFTGEPHLPFYMLQVGGGDVVSGMQNTAAKMENVYFIPQSTDPESPEYLPKYGPPVGHYSYEGMKRIGLRFAGVALQTE